MELIKTVNYGGRIIEMPLRRMRNHELRSNEAMRLALTTEACHHFGREGHDWRIVQTPRGTLIPMLVRTDDGDTIHIA